MSNLPFSLITINYNDAEGLERTIKSVLSQSYTNYEHIIIDGGSTDNSVDIIKKYEKWYPNGVLKWLSEKDNGIYHAMNKGIKLASGSYLNMLNSGDWLDPIALSIVYSFISNNPDTQVFISPVRYSHPNPPYAAFIESLNYPETLTQQPMRHQGMFYKKELHNQYGFYREDLKTASDYAFCLELFYKNQTSFTIISQCFVNFLDEGRGNTHESWLEAKQLRIDYGIIVPLKPKKTLKELIKWLLPYGVWAIKQRLKKHST